MCNHVMMYGLSYKVSSVRPPGGGLALFWSSWSNAECTFCAISMIQEQKKPVLIEGFIEKMDHRVRVCSSCTHQCNFVLIC